MPAFVGMTNAVTMHDDDDVDDIMHQHPAVRMIAIMPAVILICKILLIVKLYIYAMQCIDHFAHIMVPLRMVKATSQMLTRVSSLSNK